MAGRAGEIHGDFVLLDRGADFDIKHRIGAKRIDEVQIAARQTVLIAAHAQPPAQQVDVSQKNGVVPSAAHTNVRFALESAAGPFDHCGGSSIRLHIEL